MGDELPVSLIPADGTFPSGTSAFEKRNVSDIVPAWREDLCIQCGQCSFVCPHSVIRAKYYNDEKLAGAPASFKSAPVNARGYPETRFTLQFYVEDCTGCGLCVEACPATSPREADVKAINMADKLPMLAEQRANIAFFETPAGKRSRACGFRRCPRRAVPRAAVRVFRRLRWLRRDALSQAVEPVVWRPAAGRQCHGLLLHLRR